ncbi:MAG: amidohydrolase [Bacteroidales bacterium]|nr:amidohydrolase [Bacteroidales bacterium]
MINKIKLLAERYYTEIIEARRYLHQHPELSQQEFGTMEYVANKLRSFGIEPRVGVAKTGVSAIIKGNNPDSYCVALRADYDALPIKECTGLAFSSENDGVMHACGHDMHTASLLGAAKILADIKNEIEGSVMLIFQPSEEMYPGGAYMMMEDGLFSEVMPDEIFAFHCLPEMDCGRIGMKKGKYMASTDELYLTVKGRGGHGGTPNLNIDPIVIASNVIVAMQQIVSRNADPMMPTILSFGKMMGEGRTNIIPDEVKIEGTIRTFSEEWRLEAHKRITSIAQGVAEGMGGSCDVFIDFGYPYLVNDDDTTQNTFDNGVEYFGDSKVEWLEQRMTAEDFAFFAQKIPACYFRVGTHIKDTPITNLHRPNLMIDEKSIEYAMGFMAYNAVKALEKKDKEITDK